ncbi:MAG: TonB-dependent receptor, partial [Myxococcales bacterium]|nr:TonB-dependent receptor [Myxococcales bacterium]
MMSRLRGTLVATALVALGGGSLAAQSTGTVSGRVTDERSGEPISDILLQVPGTRSSAVTDPTGRYLLQSLPPGPVTIRLSWFGYRPTEVTVEVVAGASTERDVALEPEPLPLGEVLVTAASRRAERIVDAPAPVAVVEEHRVRDLVGTGQTPLLLADLPGVQVMQSGVGSFNVNPRSFNNLVNRRLLVLVDGRDASAPFVGSPEWSTIPVWEDGTTVEVVRGPGSALYGANAFNGVLNIVNPSVRQARGTRVTIAGGDPASVSVDARHGWLSSDLRWGARVSGGYAQAGTFDESRTATGDLAAEYADAMGGATLGQAPQPGYELLPLLGQSKATPFGVPGPVTGDPDPMTTVRGEARIDHYLVGGGTITAEGGFTRIEDQVNASGGSRAQIRRSDVPWASAAWASDAFNVMAYFSARSGDQLDLASGGTFEDHSSRLHLEGQANRSFADERVRVVGGGSVRRETIDSKGTVLAPEHDGRADEYYALFGQVDVQLVEQLALVVAARVDEASLFEAEISPRGALVWTPAADQTVRATWGRAYLMPSATQRFVRFPLGPPADLSLLEAGLRASPLGPALAGVPAGTLFTNSLAVPVLTIGDDDLGPEEVTSVELGYAGQLSRVFVGVDGHYSRFEAFHTD